MSVAVICVLKSGGDFDFEYVTRLKSMVERHVTVPYTFYCLTDLKMQWSVVPILELCEDWHGWWSKIELFRPNLVEEDRIVYFDLDTFIVGNIDCILEREEDFIGLRPFNPLRAKDPLKVASGVMSWKNDGTYNLFYHWFDGMRHPQQNKGDQDYISRILSDRGLKFTYLQDVVKGIYSYKRHVRGRNSMAVDAKVICFHGRPRPTKEMYENIIGK